MPRNEIHNTDAIDTDAETHAKNVTGYTSGTRRGQHHVDLPITGAKAITPSDDTDVNFEHRYIYVEGAGDINVKFESSGSAFAIAMPDNGLLPMRVFSVQSASTTATGIWLFT